MFGVISAGTYADLRHCFFRFLAVGLCAGAIAATNAAIAATLGGGFYHSAVLLSNGTVVSFGGNTHGQVGNSTSGSTDVPSPVRALITDVSSISVGDAALFTVALKKDLSVWVWASNGDGLLGDGTLTASAEPKQVSGLSGITAVSAGQNFVLALKNDGSVWVWGYNFDFQLGDGTQVSKNTPSKVAGVSGATQIAAAEGTTLVLLSGGTLLGWGPTDRGQVGAGQLPSAQDQYYKTPTANVAVIGSGAVVDPGSVPANLSALAGIKVFLGYGNDATEMIATLRFSSFTLQ